MALFRILLTCGLFLFAGATDLALMRKRLKQRFQTGELANEGQGKEVSQSLEKSLLGKDPVFPAKASEPKKFMSEDLTSRAEYWDKIVAARKKAAKKVKKAKMKLILAKREEKAKNDAMTEALFALKDARAAYHKQTGPMDAASAAVEQAKIVEQAELYKPGLSKTGLFKAQAQVNLTMTAKHKEIKKFKDLQDAYFVARQEKRDAAVAASEAKKAVAKAFTAENVAEYAYMKTVEDTKERLKHWVHEDLNRKNQLHLYEHLTLDQTEADIDEPLVGAKSLETIEYDTQQLMKTLEEDLSLPLEEEKALEKEIETEIKAELTGNMDDIAVNKFEKDTAKVAVPVEVKPVALTQVAEKEVAEAPKSDTAILSEIEDMFSGFGDV